MQIIVALLVIFMTGCAHEVPEKITQVESGPIPVTLVAPTPEEPTAADYLQMGMQQRISGLWRYSIESLEAAIQTGNLNDAGRAMCYWWISEAYWKLNEPDNRAEYMNFFLIVAADIMMQRGYRKFAVEENGTDFVDNFMLEDKMEIAKQFIINRWKEKVNGADTGDSSTGSSGAE